MVIEQVTLIQEGLQVAMLLIYLGVNLISWSSKKQ